MSAIPVKFRVKKKKDNPEHRLQVSFFRWLFYRDRAIWHAAHAIPNGGSRHTLEAANLKAAGVKAGIPDVFIPFPKRNCHGLYIEFKISPNKPSDTQVAMMDRLSEYGYKCAVCYNIQDAMTVFEDYMKD